MKDRFELQSGDASNVKRNDKKYNSKKWGVTYSSDDKFKLLEYVLSAINGQDLIDTENCFFRVVDNETKEVTCF